MDYESIRMPGQLIRGSAGEASLGHAQQLQKTNPTPSNNTQVAPNNVCIREQS